MTKAALLIIDVQIGMFAFPEQPYDAENVLLRIGSLVQRARAATVPVIFVQHDGGAGHPLEKPNDNWKVHTATGYRDGDIVIEKRQCDAFQDTSLHERLQQQNIETLIVAGLCTDYCVDTSCRRAFSLGYKVVLATDAHSTFANKILSAEQIVQHHNTILGDNFVTLQKASDIKFYHMKNESNQ